MQSDILNKVLTSLGVYDNENKITFKHSIVSAQEELDVKPWDSYHNLSLQTSKFITLDHDMKHLQKVYGHNLKSKDQDQKNEVVPRFCPEDEVEAKNNQKIVFKGAFLAKIRNLK